MHLFKGIKSISSQLTYGFITFALVAVFASGALLMSIADDYSSRDRQRLLNLEARLAAERINGYSEGLFNRLNYLASIPGLINMPQEAMENLLHGLSRLNHAYRAVGIAHLNGELIAHAGHWDDLGGNLESNQVFGLAAKSRFNAIGPLSIIPGTGLPAIEIAVPVRDRNGNAAGVLWAQVSLKYLMLVLGDLPIGQTGYGYIVDDKDFLIALDDTGSPWLEPLNAPELQQAISRSLGYGMRPEPYPGLRADTVFGTVSPVTSLGLRLVVEMPQAEINAPRTAMINATLVALIILAACAAVLAYLFSRRFIRPLHIFTKAAKQVGEGDLDTYIHYPRDNELGTLATTFNDMIARLRNGLKSLNEEIVERKHAEQALRIAEQHYRSIFERALEGIIQTNVDGRILIANPAAAAIFGYDTPGEFLEAVGDNIAQIYADPDYRNEFLDQILSGQPISGMEMVMLRKDGEKIWVLLHAQASMDGKGEYTLIDSVFQDVTERKKAERALASLNATLERTVQERTHDLFIKARELEEANNRLRQLDRMKSSFLSSVSHELRTPLTSILGFAKLIRKEFQRSFASTCENDSALERKAYRIVKNLQVVEKEGDRLTRLVNDVLDLNKIESGKVDWEYRDVDVEDLINHSVSLVLGQYSAKPELELQVEVSSGLPLLHADHDRMTQVLINLLNNAEKFTEKGTVTVRAFGTKDGLLRIEVEDTGRGIPAEELLSIFDKFQQVKQGDTLRSPLQGTGLGLAICRNIVEHHGGHIWAESELNRGTSIIMELPLQFIPSDQLAPVTESDDKAPLILVVDDDPGQRHYLSGLLKRAGYRTMVANDGGTALRMARQHTPDLITMDIVMPGMDGVETIQWLRKDDTLKDIPVIVLSVLSNRQEPSAGDALINKPVTPQKLLNTVTSLLKK